MCNKKEHNLQKLYSAPEGTPGVDEVVRWCRDCGAVVIDVDVDGRPQPGRVMDMKFPSESLTKKG